MRVCYDGWLYDGITAAFADRFLCDRVVGVRGFLYVSVFVVFISTALVLNVVTRLFWTADSFCNIS